MSHGGRAVRGHAGAAAGRAAPCVPGVAGRLPFADQSFDAAMAVLTDQHWPDVIAGYREMRRVARRVVTFHFDISRLECDFWLIRDYLPEHAQLRPGRRWPSGPARSAPGWSRSPSRGTAATATSPPTGGGRRRTWTSGPGARSRCGTWSAAAVEERVVRDLRADLESGRWAGRNSELLDLDEIDLGGRLLIA